ncbi:MAG: polymer-forming cytoskeletal protein [Hyphomicrobiales bacterium]|nr:polymer-forming cytoskeletal protein [Hyphomicrobiales bacterium]MCY4048561.1 polymer-forming cytoskeletal protein [Hyphomicrobiales bacterium]MCY4053269.1 polymer-forming cytoskeletal protein [Hyphomicrobiales bacterium]
MFRKAQKESNPPQKVEDSGKADNIPSFLSADLCITGDLISNGELHVEGKVEGAVRAKSITVGEKGQVIGTVTGNEVTICGRVNGDVCANKLHLTGSANVVGDLEHNSLSMEAGATLEGKCHRVNKHIDANVNGSTQAHQARRQQKINEPITSI